MQNKRKSLFSKLSITSVLLALILFVCSTAVVFAYFSAESKVEGDINFATIEVNLLDANDNTDNTILDGNSFSMMIGENLIPGQTVTIDKVKVKNVGADCYALANLLVAVIPTDYSAEVITMNKWYNLDNQEVDTYFPANTTSATVLGANQSKTLNLSFELDGETVTEAFMGGDVRVTITVYGTQTYLRDSQAYVKASGDTALGENINTLYASYFICKEASKTQPSIKGKNLFDMYEMEVWQQNLVDSGVKLSSMSIVDFEGRKCLQASPTSLRDTQSKKDYYFPINAKPNTQYTLSYSGYLTRILPDIPSTMQITGLMFHYTDDTSSSVNLINEMRWQNIVHVSTKNKTVVGIRIFYYSNVMANYTNIMIEEGTSATQYEPHYEFDIPTSYEEPLRTVNGVSDTYDPDTETLTRNVKHVELTGSEGGWWLYGGSTSSQGISFGLAQFTDAKIGYQTSYCSHFKNVDIAWAPNHSNKYLIYSDHANNINKYFRAPDSSITTLDEFKEYLKAKYDEGNPVEIWYQLANPITSTRN